MTHKEIFMCEFHLTIKKTNYKQMKISYKFLFLFIICAITTALYLWPDFHPEKVVVNDHHWYYDLIIHGGYFFVMTGCVLFLKFKKPLWQQASVVFIFSVILELLQFFSFNRSVDMVDVLSNLAGVTGAACLFLIFKKMKLTSII